LGFERIPNHYHDLILHEIPNQVIEHDLSLHIKDRFFKLGQERSFLIDWPGESPIKTLIAKSVPLFVSAATLCRFVSDANWGPQKRLDAILADQAIYARAKSTPYRPGQPRVAAADWESKISSELLFSFSLHSLSVRSLAS
jgi:hypothetical protein